MNKYPPLRDFCHSAHIYSSIRYALWRAKGINSATPSEWEPEPDDFLSLDDRMIINVGKVSLKILRAWVAASN